VANNLGMIALKQGRLDEALKTYQDGLELLETRHHGALYLRALFEASLGATFIRWGQAKIARQHLGRSQAYCEQIEARDFLPKLHRLWAEAALLEADFDEASEQAGRSLKLARELGMRGDEGRTLRVLGEVYTAQGHLQGAVEHLQKSIAILADAGAAYERARSELALAKVRALQGAPRSGNDRS